MADPEMLEHAGARLAYWREGSGPGVLLIQGAGAVGSVWRPQVDGLSAAYTTVSFDNRGIGASQMPAGGLSIEAMAEDAIAIAGAAGLDQFHLVAHSMGGLIAQEVALRAAGRVRSLSLLCTFARGRQATRMTPDMIVIGLRTRVGTRAARRKAFMELVAPEELLAARGAGVVAAEMNQLFQRDLADQPPIIMKQLGAMRRYDASARLANLATIPTLVVSGALDRIALPAFSRELAAAIPGARLLEIAGAAHSLPIHQATAVNALLTEHFGVAQTAK
jgi:pimeloyl-ACP methyl ester carboxylesterase